MNSDEITLDRHNQVHTSRSWCMTRSLSNDTEKKNTGFGPHNRPHSKK